MTKNVIKRIIIAFLIAVIIFFVLYKNIQSENSKIVYIDVIVAKQDILPDQKITAEDIDTISVPQSIAKDVIKKTEAVVNKYSKETIYAGEIIRTQNIKAATKKEIVDPSIREVRILTNISAYGGVGKGDKVDIIYVGKTNKTDIVGKILYQGLEVMSVLNGEGKDLDQVEPDKYKEESTIPVYIVFNVEQDKALKLQTLQGTDKEVCFKLIKWTNDSEFIITPPGIQIKEQLIYQEGSENK